MAQILLYIEAIYILLSVLYSISNGCLSVTVETSDEIVNASQNFSVVCEADCGFLHYEVIYSGDPVTGTPPSGIVDLNGLPIDKITTKDPLKANFLLEANHKEHKDSCDGGCNFGKCLRSSLQVIAPIPPGNYYFRCYTEKGFTYSGSIKEVIVLRDEETTSHLTSQPSSSTLSPVYTSPTVSNPTTSTIIVPSSVMLVWGTTISSSSANNMIVQSSASLSSPQGTADTEMPTQSKFPIESSSNVEDPRVTSIVTSKVYISYCATSSISLPPTAEQVNNPNNDVIKNEIIIGTVLGFLLILSMMGTITALIMACKFKRQIHSQSKHIMRNRNLSSTSNSCASSNEDIGYSNPSVVHDLPPLSP